MTLEDQIRAAVTDGSQVHIWPEHFGDGFTATVRGAHGCRHTSITGPDPIAGLRGALTEDDRKRREAERSVGLLPLEVAAAADGFEDILG